MKRFWEACLGLALLIVGAMTLGIGLCTINTEVSAVVGGYFAESLSTLAVGIFLFVCLALVCWLILNELIKSLSSKHDSGPNGESP